MNKTQRNIIAREKRSRSKARKGDKREAPKPAPKPQKAELN